MSGSFLVGVDGGGTQTRAVLCDADGKVLGRGASNSSNLYNLGEARALENVVRAIDLSLAEAGVSREQIRSYGFGLAGAVGQAEQNRWRALLEPHFGERLQVEEDVVAALVGAFGPKALREGGGAVLIAGTGANCLGQNVNGERERADGWGPLLGDRGSGFWLGEAGIRVAVAAFDGAAPPTLLQNSLLEHFAVANLNALVGLVYAPDFERQRIAAFAPRVLEAAQNNDATATLLVRDCAVHLAGTAMGVMNRLGINELALTGGLVENSTIIRATLERHLDASITTRNPLFEPVVGAAFLPRFLETS